MQRMLGHAATAMTLDIYAVSGHSLSSAAVTRFPACFSVISDNIRNTAAASAVALSRCGVLLDCCAFSPVSARRPPSRWWAVPNG